MSSGKNILQKELEKFRYEWKREIKEPLEENAKHEGSSAAFDINDDKDHAKVTSSNDDNDANGNSSKNDDDSIRAFVITEKLLKRKSAPKTLADIDSAPTNRPSTSQQEFLDQKKRIRLSSDVYKEKHPTRILDLFLSDLAEIDDIPFFDIDLPRELALKIFQHLDPRDLCRCCQVSKAWKNLAEDEFLWSEICHKFGWEKDSSTVDLQQWKDVVRSHVTEEKHIQHNWKMRYGVVKQLEYVPGGVISAVNSSGASIVAGYSNGEVRLWDVNESDECTFSASSKAITLIDGGGSIPNYVFSAAVCRHYTAGFYSSGTLDIWENDGKTSPVHSFPHEAHLSGNKCVVASHATDSFLCTHGNSVNKITNINTEVTMNQVFFEGEIQFMKFVPLKLPSEVEAAVFGSEDSVAVHSDWSGQYNVIQGATMQKITAVDCNAHSVALGVDSLFGSQRVKTYDVSTCKEESLFKGLTSTVNVINMESSPPQSFVVSSNHRINVYDTRHPMPVIQLDMSGSRVSCLQMDEWKLVSGFNNGLISVWDLRTNSRLWEAHNRHSVKHLHFTDHLLVTANLRPHQDLVTLEDAFEGFVHGRNRGSIFIYDFREKALRKGLPDICHSNFDEPEAFNYNIRLAMPYDCV